MDTDHFEPAVDAIVRGDAVTLASLLERHPTLVHARSNRDHRATLLHYLGANGVEEHRQKSPSNAVDIAKIILDAGAEVDALADIYGKSTTLGLVATSTHPRRAGVQIPLLETLLHYGAAIDGVPELPSPLLAALHNGHREAAEFLAKRGAILDLEGAAGVGRLDVVQSRFRDATQRKAELGLLWACEYGRMDVIHFLLKQGVDINSDANTGMTSLHWAIVGGQVDAIKLLLQQGANLEARNKYGGTALGQALWSASNGDPDFSYAPVIEALQSR